jgi:hypothetical protein
LAHLNKGTCRRPFFIRPNGVWQLVPCLKCLPCKARRVSAWSFRLMQEMKRSTSAHFITLKYNDTNLPISKNGYHTLSKKDLQLFFKRLRKHNNKRVEAIHFRYFAAGEYGGKIGRPHYHIILFNARPQEVAKAWTVNRVIYRAAWKKSGRTFGENCRVKEVRDAYAIGHVHYGSEKGVTEAACGYTLKYCLKPKQDWKLYDDDSETEFLCMSKHLGENYITPAMVAYHRADLNNRMYCNLKDGKKIAMPRYYKDKIYTQKERDQISEAVRDKLRDDIYKQFMELSSKEILRQSREEKQKTIACDRRQQSLIKIHYNDKERKTLRRSTKVQNKLQSTSLSSYARGKYYAIENSTKSRHDSKRVNDQVRIRATTGCRKNADI